MSSHLASDKLGQRVHLIWLGLLVSGLVLLWFSEFSDWGHRIEFGVSGWFYQMGVGFPLRNNDAFEFWWHVFPKRVLYLLPLWALIQIVYGTVRLRKGLLNSAQKNEWQRWLAILLIGLMIPLILSLLKQWTNQACPWSIDVFGGRLPYVHLLDPRPWKSHSQACWPAGHAAVGLSLLIVTFVGGFPRAIWNVTTGVSAPRSKWLSGRAFLVYALVLSMALGFSQVMRGAHFISHQFWSLWITLVFLMICVRLGLIKTRWWQDANNSF